MKDLLAENNQQKHQFKSYYCAGCKQAKPCQLLTGWDSEWKSYCCACYYESEQEKKPKSIQIISKFISERRKKGKNIFSNYNF